MYSSLSQLPILFTILNGIVCLLGDELVRWNANSLLSRAICDNVTHALNGMLCAVIITLRANVQLSSNARFILILCGALVSSCIDLDHFIMARSLTLQRAVSIGVRPFLHNTTIPVLLILLIIPIDKLFTTYRVNVSIYVYIVIGSFLVHHTRDANRRGYWIYPFGSTSSIPTVGYVIIIMLIPLLLCQLQNMTSSNYYPQRLSKTDILTV